MAEAVRFRGRVRSWERPPAGAFAVLDVPAELVDALGGRTQYRVSGTLNGSPSAGSGRLAAGGGYCTGVSQGALKAAGAAVGDELEVSISRA